MKTVSLKTSLAVRVLAPAATALMVVAPFAAFAQTTVGVDANATVSTPVVSASASTTVHAKGTGISITAAIGRADKEIDRRITNLNDLASRIGQMKEVSASEKTTLQASITAQINELTTLKAKIDADTDTATLKTDVQSITKDYRIYMLVIPQGRIIAAADRIQTIVSNMQAIETKLQTRISAAQSAGKDVSAATTAYADMQAKLSDASAQATAAANEVANLTPDQGNSSTQSANTAALKDAEAKIKTATADLKAARANISTIVSTVKGYGSVSATTTASTSVNVH